MTQCPVLGYLEPALPIRSPFTAPNTVPDWAVEVQLSDGSGGLAQALLLREHVAHSVEAWGVPGEGRIEHIGSTPPVGDSVSVIGFALRRLTPLGRPVYAISDAGVITGAGTLSLGVPRDGSSEGAWGSGFPTLYAMRHSLLQRSCQRFELHPGQGLRGRCRNCSGSRIHRPA